jgi:nitrate/nitrite transport system substrate-binding protein
MQRRTFIKYTSLGVASSVIAACTQNTSNTSSPQNEQASNINFGKLEKTYLTLGYVGLTDAAPLIIAKEKGFFSRYGLTVGFSRQASWEDIEDGLIGGRLDGAQALYGMPMQAQLRSNAAPMISLMTFNLNGSAIALSQKVWEAGIRPLFYYANFQEFADSFREYIRGLGQPPSFATEAKTSMDTYLYRYWLAAMGIDPNSEMKLAEIPPQQLLFKLQAGNIFGYCVGDPWIQDAVIKKAGFVAYASRDIWKGHPSKVLATMQAWIEDNPTTARALVAALVEACQYCDRAENRPEIAQILSQDRYLNISPDAIAPSLNGKYSYSQLDENNNLISIPDFEIFNFQETDYLKKPDTANYPWRSHAVWLLTQMIRWNQIEQKEYPKDADKILNKIYPVAIYEEVAKALKIELPKDKMKKEAATAFIDKREFDPSQPVAYLNQFELRAERSQFFPL